MSKGKTSPKGRITCNVDGKVKSKTSFSRDMELKQVNLQIEDQEFEHEYIYRSCCMVMDKRALDFFCKMFIILSVLIFSFYNLAMKADHSEIYFSLISSIISLFMSPPQLKK